MFNRDSRLRGNDRDGNAGMTGRTQERSKVVGQGLALAVLGAGSRLRECDAFCKAQIVSNLFGMIVYSS